MPFIFIVNRQMQYFPQRLHLPSRDERWPDGGFEVPRKPRPLNLLNHSQHGILPVGYADFVP